MNCLYLHIPFCLKKCHYCSFCSFVSSAAVHKDYLKAIILEVSSLEPVEQRQPLSSLFLGGGTPTSLQVEDLVSIISHCSNEYGFAKTAEISVVANPGTVDEWYLEQLLVAGVNRLSFGVQSFNDEELHSIGRLHNKKQALEAYSAAQNVGFSNINIDLMSGLPHQTPDSWAHSLEQAVQLEPQHLSLYQLMLEEGTRFGLLAKKGELELPCEDHILKMDAVTNLICCREKYIRYETSNYARPGYQCRHNINYWENRDYFAAGAAAVSYVSGVREKRENQVEKYIDKIFHGLSVVTETECLHNEESFRETVIMGLRMKCGVNVDDLLLRYGMTPEDHYRGLLTPLLQQHLLERTETHLRITDRGWPFSNIIMAELV